ncbi:MAG TPA: DoxX family protein [Vicinamibacterales bacterium]
MSAVPELKLLVDNPKSGIDVFTTWVVRGPVVLAFVAIGASKFNNDPHGQWFKIFAQIGVGQWFRYFTGVMQVTGALLMLTRWTRTLGAAMLACTMIGAALVDIFVIHAVGYALAPLVLLGAVGATWFTGRT